MSGILPDRPACNRASLADADERDRAARTRPRATRPDLDPLLTLDEVAAFLTVSPRTVRRLLAHGLPCVRLGRVVRFRQADLLRFVEARKE
jgi:excisionase family DNA binding protein